ncbi:MAG: cyclomaltodextrinase C-terminal domain-containing protein [Bacteroidales bacterium]
MSNPNSDAHGEIRSDFPGGWKGDEVNAFDNKGLNNQQLAAKNYIRTVLNWRKNKECIHKGKLTHYDPLKGVYVFFRYTDNEMVMVILNKNETEVKLDMNRFKEVAGGYKTATDLFTDRVYFLENLTIPARSPLILELR